MKYLNETRPPISRSFGEICDALGYALGMLAILAALALVGCADDLPTAPTPSNNTTQTVTVIVGPSAPGNTAASGCGASDPSSVTSVEVFPMDPAVTSVSAGGEAVLMNATPKPKASDECNLSRGISWTAVTPATCSMSGETTSFTPKVKGGPGTGQCCVSARVLGTTGVFCLPAVP